MQKFATTAPIAAVLDIPAGRIQFIAADRTDATVEVRPADAAKSRDQKAAEQVEVAYADGVLRIAAAPAANRLLGNSGAVQVTVELPAGSRVEARTAAAELRSTGRLGEVTVEGAQGSIALDEAGAARLTLQAGDIAVARLAGPADISTQQGDIRIAEAVRGTLTLRTEQGHISIAAAPGTSASLDAGTAYGRIANSLNNTRGAAPELTVHATTTHGNITAQSL